MSLKVVDLGGRACTISLPSRPRANPSGPHLEARALLEKAFPCDQRYEEVAVPGERLFLDFFLPARRLIVEVQGVQHAEFNRHFHGDQSGFMRSLGRDGRKKKWADLNGFTLIELRDGEQEKWEEAVRKGG